jgi:hypothetical protein
VTVGTREAVLFMRRDALKDWLADEDDDGTSPNPPLNVTVDDTPMPWQSFSVFGTHTTTAWRVKSRGHTRVSHTLIDTSDDDVDVYAAGIGPLTQFEFSARFFRLPMPPHNAGSTPLSSLKCRDSV